jgi:heme exporter protein C
MATAGKYLLGIWIAACVAASFLWLQPAIGFQNPDLARVVVLHIPNAIVALIASFTAVGYGCVYLARGRRLIDDARSKNAAALGMIFCLLTTITGAVFAKVQWGSYWNWDPKQICMFLLLLIYAAYFVLRAGLDDPDRRASVSAVYVIFAGLMTPLLGYVIPRYMPSLHPKNAELDPRYLAVFWSMTAGMLTVYAWMFKLAIRVDRARLAFAELAED